jgi:Glycogen recognition site of AMP-activated protein kinase
MIERDAFSREAQRYLDGEPTAQPEPEERAVADRLAAEARAYLGRLDPMPASLDDAVMAAVRLRAPAARPGPYHWLVTPQTVRLRPVWAVPVLAAAAALVLWLAPGRPVPVLVPRAAPVVAVAASDTVFVRFELTAPEARSVAVAGSFNGWRTNALAMTRGAGGVWSVTAPLAVGEHHYDFVVDGTHWVPDPTAHVQVDDGFGGRNSVIVVGPKGLVRS